MKPDLTSDADRFLALLKPIERDLELYCRRLVWEPQDASDAIQNAVLRAFAAFERYRPNASFRAWLFQILTREVFALNRKHARIARHEFQLEPEELDAIESADPPSTRPDHCGTPASLAEALDEDLMADLKILTDNERAVLLLRAIGEMRYREIAESLDIPLGSVMGHLARARQKMRTLIGRRDRRPAIAKADNL
ncbi:MAG TPA: RNA polymerase sigma factor [Verrucomicrobiota bacterium]|nr:RNA polymerase sigma factor [Verrucomicrobiota bacterium]HRZ38360.1 RNA polymerase sigma factor [Candidatus Paceibacterota bacterium]